MSFLPSPALAMLNKTTNFLLASASRFVGASTNFCLVFAVTCANHHLAGSAYTCNDHLHDVTVKETFRMLHNNTPATTVLISKMLFFGVPLTFFETVKMINLSFQADDSK